jgi:hypothetical protein
MNKSWQMNRKYEGLMRIISTFIPPPLHTFTLSPLHPFFCLAALICFSGTAIAREQPQIPPTDRTRLAEAFRVADRLGDEIWKGWSKAPFAVLLVTDEHEFLVRHPNPPKEFSKSSYDPALKSDVYHRKRGFGPGMIATLFLEGIPTVVIGQAENTYTRTSTPWVIVLLHEHFHQLQYSQSDYRSKTEALNLARGDQNSMWMLNHPFPYTDPEVNKRFSALCRALSDALAAPAADLKSKAAAYFAARREFTGALSADDSKYFSFQIWQEGLARYTEYHLATLAAARYKPAAEFSALKDFTPFEQVARGLRKGIVTDLPNMSFEKIQRIVFYGFGAAEGLLLDRVNKNWRRAYLAEKFDTSKHY